MKEEKVFSDINNRIPALRIVLTSQCNLDCVYCPPKGEDFCIVSKNISTKKLLSLLKIFYEIGFRQFGFTGGEPLLRKDLPEILNECLKFKERFLKLYTNGILLKSHIALLNGLDLIKISLDSINLKKYKKITGNNKLKEVLEGIELARSKKLKVRINTVLTRYNYDDIFNVIDFCHPKAIDLKILDLNCFDIPGYRVWDVLYKSPSEVINSLERKKLTKKIIYTSGRYGIPMPEFRWDGISIRIKDTKKSSVYSPVCKNCKYFACQEGLYQLTLTSDGKLKMCKHRPDIYLDLSKQTNGKVMEDILFFLHKHYFSAKRIFSQKQVFLGSFGTGDERTEK